MKVLLIRRMEDSRRTEKRIRELGFEPVLFPLFERVSLAKSASNMNPDFLVFTSCAAVESVSERDFENFSNVPAYAVGTRTAEALEEKKYKNIRIGSGAAKELAALICSDFGAGGYHGVYYCGVERAFDMEAALLSCDISLELCEVYRIERLVPDPNELKEALADLSEGAVLLYSQKSAEHFLRLVDGLAQSDPLTSVHLIGISENAILPLRKKLAKSIQIADVTSDEAMLDKLMNIKAN